MPQLTTIEMTGRFSTAAIEQLAKNAPRLSGTVRTLISEAEYGKRRRVGRLALEPMIHLKTHHHRRFDPEKIKYAEVVFPATLEDLAQLQGYRDAIEEIRRDRPSFIIAHRFSTVITADVIVVMDDGRIVAQGQHDQLIETCPLYQSLYETQLIKT